MQRAEASRDEAQVAVRFYNDPSAMRPFVDSVVHMHLAWLYVLHAELTPDEVDFRYSRSHDLVRTRSHGAVGLGRRELTTDAACWSAVVVQAA
jgi:hypothetical protein